MRRLAEMGLKVRISEIDARMSLPGSDELLAQQADAFRTMMRACLDSPNCTDFYPWGIDDAHSWIDGFFQGFGRATMFDRGFQPKPAYHALLDQMRSQQRPITNAASGASVVAPGSWITIWGDHGLTGERRATELPLPPALGDLRVTLNGEPLPLNFANGSQINAQLLYEAPLGDQELVVHRNSTTTTYPIRVVASAPGVFQFGS
ncbi:MAG: hypothetical protein GY953_07130, partial [bacterium]|nr:hypothetical protein [bacterium]